MRWPTGPPKPGIVAGINHVGAGNETLVPMPATWDEFPEFGLTHPDIEANAQ
jgi:hypothetical protein